MRIVAVDDLVRMKQAAGRPSDLEDVEVLMAIARDEAQRD